MISRILYTLEKGVQRIRQNTKLLFLVVVLFVFPLLFVVVLEQFYDVAKANTQTMEQQYIAAVHDSATAASVAGLNAVSEALSWIKTDNPEFVGYRLFTYTQDDTLVVLQSSEQLEIGSTSTAPTLIRTTLQEPDQTFTTPVQLSSGRLIQAARQITIGDKPLYLYTEHSFAAQDAVFTQRKQEAYITLSFIFIFVIGLAYWIARQVDWERRHNKLQETLKERDLFSNMIAHEFRTPLTAIKGYASFLQESTSISKEEKRYADTIGESAERLVLLVNDFLEIARIQSGRMKIETKQIDVRTTIETVTKSLSSQASEKGLQLVFTPDLKPQTLITDNNRFVQILTNIISNSVKYTQKGTVEVSCVQDRSGITIRVKDTGMGISADDQQKLFAPFSRVGGVEKTTTTGTGLGMWITKQLIELLNGTIAVESIKGVGTHVVLTFKDVEPSD